MESIVAFLDILGTKDMVKRDQFSDLLILDFVNVVCLAARMNPKLRFAAFSDSVIISAKKNNIVEFVSALSFIYSNWFGDEIFVRGGIALGEIRWVYQKHTDKLFLNLPNLMYTRVYGKALIDAHEIEHKSGPGAICFVTERASIFLKKINTNYILDGMTRSLVWADSRHVIDLCASLNSMLTSRVNTKGIYKHIAATYYYFCQLKESGKFLPPIFNDNEIDGR